MSRTHWPSFLNGMEWGFIPAMLLAHGPWFWVVIAMLWASYFTRTYMDFRSRSEA